ncbi:dicarboxylate/amino acid:cation symporter [Enterococcus faecalis]|jgi:proton glutamate symport protein|uniref:dicarboxylate/amino acid:cation symporter n=1 Tax=Enterococcus faecalis TaxID=1351 RepID=UPI000CF18E5A|nr:dicarboxylate/amino acid:cation symporter [Enterococcus faecalis]EGO5016970.1 dicarboxylate/amino acid:cation symporter [Enterococcus faecalis]EGO5080962.1 dicarboxylate/amino acid:cation symporter [Enterococcus faecalis]EGO6124383.1 dicarboxylate/amino acid:cation symporter [Enterococcus faecalis]EGO6561493.1 dicarboxylate/amino acid:cation symporter [Enterococcus faecalis]EGO7560192.1 dicarboxylate/amino acid:cation symporter [Enterococcus faecalis]
MKKPSMITLIAIAVVVGILVGLLIPASGNYLKIVGDVFLRLMQMAIPILILGQIVQAVGSINPKELTSLGGRTIAVFGISSLAAALWGVLMAVIFNPGYGVKMTGFQDASIKAQEISITDTILNFVPKNIFDSLTQGSIIQIIVFALFFGLALNKYLQSHPETQLFQIIVDFNEVIITVIRYVMYLAPLGIFALIASTISHLGLQIILPLVKYLLVYGLGTILFLGIWILVITLYCKVSPLRLITNMKNMSVMALATTSSAITLPVALEETETKLGLSKRITNLVLPLGMSLNSNGSAMHMAFTVMTIAQMYQLDFDITKMIYLAITATFVSLANAVVPGAGLVSLAVIVPQMGLPIESIAIFAGVEWFVGMLRTILNVNSDVYSAILVAKSVDEIDYTVFNSSNK